MKEKQNDLFTIGVAAAIILIFSMVDFFAQISPFFAKYDTEPTAAPEFTLQRFLSGEYAQEYEKYARENFRNHEKWEKLLLDFRILLGKRDVNGVYLGEENTYFEQRLAADYTEKLQRDSLDYLEKLAEELGAKVMLVPTSDEIWENRLPSYAGFYDQKRYLDEAGKRVDEENWIDLYSVLLEHADEEIYYRTDPHWTSLGACYGYYTWWQVSGKPIPYYYNPSKMVTVTDSFCGSLQMRSGRSVPAEQLQVFSETLRIQPTVQSDGGVLQTGFYRKEALESENPYEYFVGKECGLTVIQTGYERMRSLLVIGDSYANCMLPLLAPHYQTVYLVNPRLYDGSPADAAHKYGQDGKLEILILCSVPGMIEMGRDGQQE